MFDKIMVTIER